jgi:NAD(P)H-dependent FMN reductase
MKILAFAGSNSTQSINLKLVKFALSYLENVEFNLLDLNDYEVAIYSFDRQKRDGFPEKIKSFMTQIEECDSIVISLAEHNRSYSVAFKNIFDWASRIDLKLFKNKPMFLMSTSPGGLGGGNVMNAAKSFFPNCGANIEETFSLPSFYQNFNEQSGIINPDLRSAFEKKMDLFKEKINYSFTKNNLTTDTI